MEPVNGNSNIYPMRDAACIKTAHSNESDGLRESCREFEGVLLGVILKESMKTGMLDEDASSSSDSMRDLAIERTAHALGQSEALGISKMLYEQMNR